MRAPLPPRAAAAARPPALLPAALAAVLLPALFSGLGACGLFDGSGGGGGSAFAPVAAARATNPNAEFDVHGRWLVYTASESQTGPFGTDFNLDGDLQDSVAAVIDMLGGGEFLPRNPGRPGAAVSVEEIAVLGDEVYLVVDEDKDGFNWNGDASTTDLVLLHWTLFAPTTTLVATLDSRSSVHTLATDDALYFAIDDDPAATALAPGETTVHFVTAAAPTTPVRVPNDDGAATLHGELMALDEGLLFVAYDEVVDGVDLNGDADTLDPFVLALLDTTDPMPLLRSTALPVSRLVEPVRARSTGPGDWLVAFLVNELDAGTNLNDPALFLPAWQPTACIGFEDADQSDDVLHFLHFAAWAADPVNNPPVNTGLVGDNRVLVVLPAASSGYVATISREEGEGDCVLNGDADPVAGMTPGDVVFRWIEAVQPPAMGTDTQEIPETDPGLLLAVFDVPGGTFGVTDLAERFVIVVDEAADGRDHDGKTSIDNELVAWLDPAAAAPTWVFNHAAAGAPRFAGTDWMAERADRNAVPAADALLPMTFQESVFDSRLNPGDSDELDRLPVFARFDPTDADGDLDFLGPAVTMATNNPNLVSIKGRSVFVVEEAADARDWDFDGQQNDIVLVTSELASASNTFFVTTLRRNATTFIDPLIRTDGDTGVAFVSFEGNAQLDLNADGDLDDRVVRWIRF